MTDAFLELLEHATAAAALIPQTSPEVNPPIDPLHPTHPILLALGGDHSIALPHLRALKTIHGESLTVVHFDAHLDTWDPRPSYGSGDTPWGPAPQAEFTHGSMFWIAAAEGLVSNYSTHLGLRTRLSGGDYGDYESDTSQGWRRFDVDAVDDYGGPVALAAEVVKHIGIDRPVYLSVDIDVLDPGLAPGTGTPEPGGWTTRELIRVLRGLEGLNVVGADIVEVAPSFDGAGEQTALAAAQVGYEILTSLVGRGRQRMSEHEDSGETERQSNTVKDEL
jgi:agmatinase